MTLDQLVDVCRRRHNAESDSFFGSEEIYQLITNRCNEVLSVIGLLEKYTTDTSVADQQAYSYPSDAVDIVQVEYDSKRLKRITLRQANNESAKGSGTPSGTPTKWFSWDRQIYLVTKPADAGDTIGIWYHQEHPYIDNSTQTTIDIPSVLHGHLANGVIADMFAKDLNYQMSNFYENKWLNVSMPAFYVFKADEENASTFSVVGDGDTDGWTSDGPV